ncbi:MAG: hypothetical protein WBW34_05550 [Nitrososphaeraceae archaeon]
MISDKNNNISEKSLAMGLLIVIAGFGLLGSGTGMTMNNNTQADAQQTRQ